MPHGYDPKVLKAAATKQLAALSIDAAGFRTAYNAQDPPPLGFRVVVRARDAVNLSGPAGYLPRTDSDAQASTLTTDILGMERYLAAADTEGADIHRHEDFVGLPGPFDGKDEVELQVSEGTWINAATGDTTQAPGKPPVSLTPPADLGTPES